ncbi:MAG: acetylesterase [Anaerolineae bacterium]|nr:acetylesterase [Anaerolineae bacterium]
MAEEYKHLGIFSDWVVAAKRIRQLYPMAPPGPETQEKVRQVLGFSFDVERPIEIRSERRWERDGLVGEEVSWSVGYGPRTHAWVLKPAGITGPLPGIVALHDHGGFKYYGKEKIADGPEDPPPVIVSHRAGAYGGRAFANALAKEGFIVLIHDTFLWGSRRFPLETMSDRERLIGEATMEHWRDESTPEEIALYNAAAASHEHLVEKYCSLLGTTLAGVVSYEDRVAVNYLLSRDDVLPERVGCVGLSGGGCRSALLQATCDRISAAVIVGMMSTYEHLLDHNVASHTWMFFPATWARYGDWPDLAACRAPSPLMVQYDLDDALFTEEGMRAAHRRIATHYRNVGHPENYVGEFYPGPHKFDLKMQESAFAWLKEHLSPQS